MAASLASFAPGKFEPAGTLIRMRLYIVRHGQTSWNLSGRAQGHTDIPLDPTGLLQAEALGRSFAGVHIDRVLSSDLLRAVGTAEPIACVTGASLELRTDLRERSFGSWEGETFLTVGAELIERACALGVSPQEVRPPGGESYADVWARVDPVVAEIESADCAMVVASHGGACALLTAKLIRGTLDTARSLHYSNTGVTQMTRRPDGTWRLDYYDDTSHLRKLQALTGGLDGVHEPVEKPMRTEAERQ